MLDLMAQWPNMKENETTAKCERRWIQGTRKNLGPKLLVSIQQKKIKQENKAKKNTQL